MKFYIARTTALEAIAPIVICGYLFLNQAERAPGYDPPIVIHGFFGVILYWPDFDICFIKYARSFKACYAFKYFKFGIDKEV